VKTYIQDFIKRLFKDINTNLLRRFNQEFKFDESRKERNWVLMEETAIEELWGKCRANVEHIFKDFRYIAIDFTFKRGSVTPDGSMVMPQDEEYKAQRSPSMMYAKLLTEQDITKVKDKFFEDINNALDEAKRKHHNIT